MKTIIADTCDVVFKRLSDGKVLLNAEAQLASVTQSIREERLKGGIGNKDIAILRSDKEVALKVRSAVFDSEWLEMVNGTKYSSETNTIHQKEEGIVVKKSLADLEITLEGEPKTDGKIVVFDSKGLREEFDESDLTDGTLTLALLEVEEGDIVTALYEMEVTGNTLLIDATKFPEKVMVEYHTIEYDIETNEIVNDLYWIFDSATPKGEYDYSFENGQAITPEIDFTALAPTGSNIIGKVIEIPRVA